MKKTRAVLCAVAIATAGLFSFQALQTGSIKGSVTPPEGGLRVWAVSGPDTLRSDITSGAFQISDAKPGVYRLIVEANPPYKSQAKDSIVVADGEVTDVGVITLQQ
ncbi:MAG: carboxypeptidase-like regulatory domain-containing protein [Flavisolibacter sp.]